MSTVVLGGGKMGEALAAGLAAHGREDLVVVETLPARRDEIGGRLRTVATLAEAVDGPGFAAIVAVKPQDVAAACADLDRAGAGRVLSVAAGVTLAALEGWLPSAAVLRAMPNTPALVGAAASAVSAGRRAGPDDVAWATGILSTVGHVVELPESSLDAVTGLSGSGPAYVFLLAEALIDAGVLVGLTRQVARELAVQTILGAGRLMAETGDEPSALRAAVTSPGGTTAAGLRALEAGRVRASVMDAVVASAERSAGLGRPH